MLDNILLADGDLVQSEKLKTFLCSWGYDVTFSLTENNVLESLDQRRFAVILLGFSTGNGGCLDLYKKIRNLPNGDTAYIIMLSSRERMDEVLSCLSMGVNDYLLYPVEATDLKARVSAGRRIARLEAELSEKVKQLELYNNRMKQDLDEAIKIQHSMLPQGGSDLPRIDFSWHFNPCDEISGDMLNIFRLDDRHLGLYVLDVCGHGIPAALLSMSITNDLLPRAGNGGALKRYFAEKGHKIIPPGEAAHTLNMGYQIHDSTLQYFTILFGIIEVDSLLFQYVRAGHPPPIVVGEGGEARLLDEGADLPMGLFPESEYVERQVQLKPKDRLYIFSDGVNEATNKAGEQFGFERVVEKLSQVYKEASLEESIKALSGDIESWQVSQKDDISIIGIEVTDEPDRG